MRTTLTLVGNQVATAAFFMSHGEGNHKTNNAVHLVVDWDPQDFYKSASIRLVDGAGKLQHELNAVQILAVEKFCRQYVNFYKEDLEKLNA